MSDPSHKSVIRDLLNKELGRDEWIFKRGKKCYIGYTLSRGYSTVDSERQISKSKYKLIKALQLILKSI